MRMCREIIEKKVGAKCRGTISFDEFKEKYQLSFHQEEEATNVINFNAHLIMVKKRLSGLLVIMLIFIITSFSLFISTMFNTRSTFRYSSVYLNESQIHVLRDYYERGIYNKYFLTSEMIKTLGIVSDEMMEILYENDQKRDQELSNIYENQRLDMMLGSLLRNIEPQSKEEFVRNRYRRYKNSFVDGDNGESVGYKIYFVQIEQKDYFFIQDTYMINNSRKREFGEFLKEVAFYGSKMSSFDMDIYGYEYWLTESMLSTSFNDVISYFEEQTEIKINNNLLYNDPIKTKEHLSFYPEYNFDINKWQIIFELTINSNVYQLKV